MRRSRLGRVLMAGTLFVIAACSPSENRLPTFPVTGKVFVNGKPAEHASVVFHPVGGATDAVRPRGKVGADGSFQLTTYDGNDGAPAGQYQVTVEWYLANLKNSDAPPSNRLNAKFARPETSGLTAEVAAAPTELKAFELK